MSSVLSNKTYNWHERFKVVTYLLLSTGRHENLSIWFTCLTGGMLIWQPIISFFHTKRTKEQEWILFPCQLLRYIILPSRAQQCVICDKSWKYWVIGTTPFKNMKKGKRNNFRNWREACIIYRYPCCGLGTVPDASVLSCWRPNQIMQINHLSLILNRIMYGICFR